MGIFRFRLGELSLQRLASALARRGRDLPHRLAWVAGAARRNARAWERHRGLHAGRRCFILGNGPSLAQMDLSPLREEISFGLNRIYLLFDRLSFRPTYYCATNELVLSQFAGDIRALAMPKFLNWNCRALFADAVGETLFVKDRLGLRDGFEGDPRCPLSSGGTVTYTALQIAYFMGFAEAILVGVDHSFADQGRPNREVVRGAGADANHFHPGYFPSGTRWQLPDLLRSERAYALARDAFRARAGRVLNASVGSRLEVLSRVAFEALFEEEKDPCRVRC
jgi:hypothetical protein